jgi:hypothetical protein
MSTLANLEFVEKIPSGTAKKRDLSPLDRAKTKLVKEIDLQMKLVKDPKYSVRKVVNKRDGSTETAERRPRSWVAYSDDNAYITVRISNKPVNIGGQKGSVIRCPSNSVLKTFAILKEWVASNESDELIKRSIQNSKRISRKAA